MRINTKVEVLCFLITLLFAYTGISKILEHNIFTIQLVKATLLGRFRETIAWLLPLSELIVALLLVFKKTRLTALYISLIMLLVFTIYLTGMLLFNSKLPCKCGGVISQMTWKQHVFFNLFFIGIAWAGIKLEKMGRAENRLELSVFNITS